jgi:Putative Flp pilus-assembly TadE/G-like
VRTRDQSGQLTMMIIGLAGVLAMGVAVVTDASAAYLQRQGLDSLADGAALAGADLGVAGPDVYATGVDGERLAVTEAQARRAVTDYLARAGAHAKYPGLTAVVSADPVTQTIRVRLTAPLHLPLQVPGSAETATIGATGAAVVALDQ